MALNSPRKGWLGVGVETSFGVGVPMTDNVPWTSNTLEGVDKPLENDAAYGIRQKVLNSAVGQKYGTGEIDFQVDPSYSGYFYAAALGSTAKTTVSGSVQKHTHSVSTSNTPYSLSIYKERIIDRQLFTGASIDTIETDVKDGFATAKVKLDSLFPTTTTSGTNTTASGTLFSWADYTYKFGSSFSAAGAASASPLTEFDFTVKNNTSVIYESGQNSATRIGQQDFECSGKMTLYFEGTTDRDNYYNNLSQAMIVSFLGAGSGTTQEQLTFNFYQNYYDTFSVNTGLDAFFIENNSFVSGESVSDGKTIDIVQVNSNSNY